MPDIIQTAPTGRAKCRGCGRTILSQELRFGESLPNPYAEGESLHWFHLACGACMRSEKFLLALHAGGELVTEADKLWLERAANASVEFPRLTRLARAERASSGRARCRSCREPIEKGRVRLVLQMFEDGRFSPIGTIHTECALAYFGTAEIVERLERLQALDDSMRAELLDQLLHPRPAAAASEEAPRAGAKASAPGIAKTLPPPEEARARRS